MSYVRSLFKSGKELGIKLTVKRLKVSDPTLGGMWRGLCRVLDSKSVVIIGLDGAERHWTVAYAATERTLRVADSCGLRMILRAQCTLGRTSLRYQLRPSDVLVVRREGRTRKGKTRHKRGCFR